MADPAQAGDGSTFDPETIKQGILVEISDLKDTAQAFGFEAIKNGTWFSDFLKSCLNSYEERVMAQGGAAYLRGKYPGLPTDAIATKLCELAESYAAVAGGLSGAVASAAVLTAGAGIPAAIAGVMAEVLYTVRLQLRLAYDLHLLYGMPLDADDPADLIKLFAVVYGVKGAEVGGLGLKAYGPEVARAQIFRLIHGNTQAIQAAASTVLGPNIAKHITQKAMIKTAVPIVGTGISAGWNYVTTHMMGIRVRHGVRVAAALREQTQRLQDKIGRNERAELAVLEGLMALALADQNFDDKENEVYRTFLKQLALPQEQIEQLAQKIDPDLETVCGALNAIEDGACKEPIARSFCLITAADGQIVPAEEEVLKRLLTALGQDALFEELPALAKRFQRQDGAIDQALFVIGDAANSAGAMFSNAANTAGVALGDVANTAGVKAGEALKWASQFLNKAKPAEAAPPEVAFEESVEEKKSKLILAGMEMLTQRFAAGELSADDYAKQLAVLSDQLKS